MAGLIYGYTVRFELESAGRRMLAAILPGYGAQISDGERTAVVIEAGIGGHFAVNASINGKAVALIADTGASAVTLTPEDARTAGIDIARLDYAVTVSTANGPARAAPFTLKEVAVGNITAQQRRRAGGRARKARRIAPRHVVSQAPRVVRDARRPADPARLKRGCQPF